MKSMASLKVNMYTESFNLYIQLIKVTYVKYTIHFFLFRLKTYKYCDSIYHTVALVNIYWNV